MSVQVKRSVVALAFVALAASAVAAQDWRGMGRVAGKVVDEDSGQPIADVTVKAMMPRSGNRGPDDVKSNDKGDWALGGLASGEWAFDFVKDGYETRQISLPVSEGGGRRPMEIKLKKKGAAGRSPTPRSRRS